MRLLKFDTRNRAFAALPASGATEPAECVWVSWWVHEAAPCHSNPTPTLLIRSAVAAPMGAGTPTALAVPALSLTLLHEIQLKGEMNFGATARGWEMPVHGEKKGLSAGAGVAENWLWSHFKPSPTEKLLPWLQGSYKRTMQ